MAGAARTVRIGNRPLHIALGAGHHNADGGDAFEIELTGQICRAIVELARESDGYEIRCYTPGDGLGIHRGPVDMAPRLVAEDWDPAWTIDLFHEVHLQAVPTKPEARGVFIIFPDGAGLASVTANPGEVDEDVKEQGPAMAGILAAATGLPVGGAARSGIMSERQTAVGIQGRRLRIFAATATPAMITHSCRFITEVGCYTNAIDRAAMSRAHFPRLAALGILRAYTSLAIARLGWSYDYRIPGVLGESKE